MNTHGFGHYVHTDTLGGIDKKRAKENVDAKAREGGKDPNKEGRRGHGTKVQWKG